MHKYTTISTSRNHAKVSEPIILEEKGTTRKIFFAEINENPEKVKAQEIVSVTIVHQRKGNNEQWIDVEPINLNKLKAGDGVRLKLNSKQTKNLYDQLSELYKLSSKGVHIGRNEYTVGKLKEFIDVPENRKNAIKCLINEKYGQEIWDELTNSDPDLATKLSFSRIHISRQKALKEFKENLKTKRVESYWQSFFNDNQWIFGYGLKYQFLSLIKDQANYGGTNYTDKGAQKGDYLLKSEADVKFTLLVEIKKPDTPIIADVSSPKYRNGAYRLSSELLGSISQIQVNCKTWLRKSVEPENNDSLYKENTYTINPRGIVVIGDTSQFSGDRKKIETFEIFRNELHNPAIITFDELYERAKFIVDNNDIQKKSIQNEVNDHDIPF